MNALRSLHAGGVFERVRDSRWRQRRLLILCYHSFAIDDEHLWRPALFMQASQFEERLAMLKQDGYNVLSLGEGLERLHRRDLPPRSVVLTFDDGSYDFYKLAYPALKKYGFPATVYQTTFYSERGLPVFSNICSYMLWKCRNQSLPANPSIGIPEAVAFSTPEARQKTVHGMVYFAATRQLSTSQKNELAAELAGMLGIDFQDLLGRRILQLMNPQEIKQLASAGVDFQLHTHRHRTPRERRLFDRELEDNFVALTALINTRPVHFCYPSGDYDLQFLPWLTAKGIISATTSDGGLASRSNDPLLLPRFVDTTGRTPLEFESWLTGIGAMLSKQAVTAALRRGSDS